MRRVLITGGSRGIGKAIAEKFESNNYIVICPSRQILDLSNEKCIEKFIMDNCNLHFDVIINNAGQNDINYLENITDEEINSMINVNLIAPIKLCRGFIKSMKDSQYGRIVNIGSIWGAVSKEGRTVYSATKYGIHGITNTLAIELASYNILVNTVCPGYTLTELTKKNNSQNELDQIAQEIPIKRLAKPSEVAEVVFFLGHETNTYITGQKIMVDGGYTSR